MKLGKFVYFFVLYFKKDENDVNKFKKKKM